MVPTPGSSWTKVESVLAARENWYAVSNMGELDASI